MPKIVIGASQPMYEYEKIKDLPEGFNTDMITGKATADWALRRNALQIIDNTTGQFVEFNLKTQTVTSFPSVPTYSLHSAMVAVLDYNFYFDNTTKAVYKKGLGSSSWTRVGTIPQGASFNGIKAIVSMEWVYIISKNLNNSTTNNIMYRIRCTDNKWQRLPNIPIIGKELEICSRKGKIFLLGGQTYGTSWNYLGNVYSYDIRTSTWTSLSYMPSETRYNFKAMYCNVTPYGYTTDGKNNFIAIRGGLDNNGEYVYRELVYDIDNDEWIELSAPSKKGAPNESLQIAGGITMHEKYKANDLYPENSQYTSMSIGARREVNGATLYEAKNEVIGGTIAIEMGIETEARPHHTMSCFDYEKFEFSTQLRIKGHAENVKAIKIKSMNLVTTQSSSEGEGEIYGKMMIGEYYSFSGSGSSSGTGEDYIPADPNIMSLSYPYLKDRVYDLSNIDAGKSFEFFTDTFDIKINRDFIEQRYQEHDRLIGNMKLQIYPDLEFEIEYLSSKTNTWIPKRIRFRGNAHRVHHSNSGIAAHCPYFVTGDEPVEPKYSNYVKPQQQLSVIPCKKHELYTEDAFKSWMSVIDGDYIYMPYMLIRDNKPKVAIINKHTYDVVHDFEVPLNTKVTDISDLNTGLNERWIYEVSLPHSVFKWNNEMYLIRAYTDECMYTDVTSLKIYKITNKFTLEPYKEVTIEEITEGYVDYVYGGLSNACPIGDHLYVEVGDCWEDGYGTFIDLRVDSNKHKYPFELNDRTIGGYVGFSLVENFADKLLYVSYYDDMYIYDRDLNLVSIQDFGLYPWNSYAHNIAPKYREEIFVHSLDEYAPCIIKRNKDYTTDISVISTPLTKFRCGHQLGYDKWSYITGEITVKDDSGDSYIFFNLTDGAEDIFVNHDGAIINGYKWKLPERRFLYSVNGRIFKNNNGKPQEILKGRSAASLTEQDYLTHGSFIPEPHIVQAIVKTVGEVNEFEILMYHEEDDKEFELEYETLGANDPQNVVCDFDLVFEEDLTIKKFIAIGDTELSDDLMFAISTDSGHTWKSLSKDDDVITISLDELKDKGIDFDSFNDMDIQTISKLTNDSNQIRFAACLKQNKEFSATLDHIGIRG